MSVLFTGPDNWAQLNYSSCAGTRQSPIIIPKTKDLKFEEIAPFVTSGFKDSSLYSMNLVNTGHTGKQVPNLMSVRECFLYYRFCTTVVIFQSYGHNVYRHSKIIS